jgi:ribosomal protein S18 acetylase RimI-like enzyme
MLSLCPGDDHETRERLLVPCMRGFVEGMLRHGRVEVVRQGGEIRAVSLTVAPGRYPPPILAQLAMARAPLFTGLRRAARFARLDRETRARHPRHPHWYLWFLGVDPGHQGKGLGSELLRTLSARADAAAVPCYLETDKLTSVRLYEKHGYQVRSQARLPVLDVDFWFMERPAPGTPARGGG